MDIALDRETSLQVRRRFGAGVAVVYAAWTDPQELKQWLTMGGGAGGTEVSIDLRVGGRYRFVMRGADGEVHRVGGVYREIEPGRRLVYTWAWESTPERESLVTVEFNAAGQGTELVVTHQRFFDSDARDRHEAGWTGCLGHLENYLAG